MVIIEFLLAAALIALGGVVFLYFRAQARLTALASELEWLRREHGASQAQALELRAECERLQRLAEQRAETLGRLEAEAARLPALEAEIERLRADSNERQQRAAELAVRLEEEQRRAAEKLAWLEDASRRLGESFENLAQRIFDEKLARFSSVGSEKLDQIIQPLRQDLQGFRQLVESGFRFDHEQRGILRGEIEQLRKLNERLSAEAEGLAKALRGEFRTRGLWGEMVLERVLESAGLEKGRDFLVQGTLLSEEGERLRPDVIVFLPEGRRVVIDAKAPLEAYLRACEALSEEEREKAMLKHAEAIRSHVAELATRGYERAVGENAVEMVLMFIPAEAALAEALRVDPALQAGALAKRIALVGPNMLLAMMQVVSLLWRLDAQSRNAREIARQAGALYDKFAAFVEDLQKLGEALARAQTMHDAALAKLARGKGNLIARTEKLKALGASPKRSLPPAFDSGAESEEES